MIRPLFQLRSALLLRSRGHYKAAEPTGQRCGCHPPPLAAAAASRSRALWLLLFPQLQAPQACMSPKKFFQFVAIGFGATIALIALALAMWQLSR